MICNHLTLFSVQIELLFSTLTAKEMWVFSLEIVEDSSKALMDILYNHKVTFIVRYRAVDTREQPRVMLIVPSEVAGL